MAVKTSPEREDAKATYPAELRTVNDHSTLTLNSGAEWIVKPGPGPGQLQATHIQLQAIGQNVRYRIDEKEATATTGFQLAAGLIALIPVPNNGISVYPETSGAIIQYQFVR